MYIAVPPLFVNEHVFRFHEAWSRQPSRQAPGLDRPVGFDGLMACDDLYCES